VYYAEPRLIRVLMERNLAQARREAEKRHLLREAGIEQQGRVSRQGNRLVGQLGALLIALGLRLQGIRSSQALPLKREPVSGS
jgi:hypothetical protein